MNIMNAIGDELRVATPKGLPSETFALSIQYESGCPKSVKITLHRTMPSTESISCNRQFVFHVFINLIPVTIKGDSIAS